MRRPDDLCRARGSVTQNHHLRIPNSRHGEGVPGIVAELDFINTGGKSLDHGSDLTAEQILLRYIFG